MSKRTINQKIAKCDYILDKLCDMTPRYPSNERMELAALRRGNGDSITGHILILKRRHQIQLRIDKILSYKESLWAQ